MSLSTARTLPALRDEYEALWSSMVLRPERVAAIDARVARIIANEARVQPIALLQPERITDAVVRAEVEALRVGETRPGGWFIETLARGVATLAAWLWPMAVVVRLWVFKTI